MRHRNKTLKLGRKSQHRHLMLANMVCSLIKAGRIQTTLQKARAVRPMVEKMITLAKSGTVHDKRLATSRLRQEDVVRKLFTELGPRNANRNGGYTRIIKIGQRIGDGGSIAFLEFVEQGVTPEVTKETSEAKAEAVPPKAPKAAKAPKAKAPKAAKAEK